MTRIAIIDHDTHQLYVEDISNEDLKRYGGSEQAYIDDNYACVNYSWDYIVDTQYFEEECKVPYDVEFEKLSEL